MTALAYRLGRRQRFDPTQDVLWPVQPIAVVAPRRSENALDFLEQTVLELVRAGCSAPEEQAGHLAFPAALLRTVRTKLVARGMLHTGDGTLSEAGREAMRSGFASVDTSTFGWVYRELALGEILPLFITQDPPDADLLRNVECLPPLCRDDTLPRADVVLRSIRNGPETTEDAAAQKWVRVIEAGRPGWVALGREVRPHPEGRFQLVLDGPEGPVDPDGWLKRLAAASERADPRCAQYALLRDNAMAESVRVWTERCPHQLDDQGLTRRAAERILARLADGAEWIQRPENKDVELELLDMERSAVRYEVSDAPEDMGTRLMDLRAQLGTAGRALEMLFEHLTSSLGPAPPNADLDLIKRQMMEMIRELVLHPSDQESHRIRSFLLDFKDWSTRLALLDRVRRFLVLCSPSRSRWGWAVLKRAAAQEPRLLQKLLEINRLRNRYGSHGVSRGKLQSWLREQPEAQRVHYESTYDVVSALINGVRDAEAEGVV